MNLIIKKDHIYIYSPAHFTIEWKVKELIENFFVVCLAAKSGQKS